MNKSDPEHVKNLQRFLNIVASGVWDQETASMWATVRWVAEGWEPAYWVLPNNWTMVHNALV